MALPSFVAGGRELCPPLSPPPAEDGTTVYHQVQAPNAGTIWKDDVGFCASFISVQG